MRPFLLYMRRDLAGLAGVGVHSLSPRLRAPVGRCAVAPGILALALLVAASPPAGAQQPPLRIGVLALGPRKVPAWQCGPQGPHKATAEPQPQAIQIDAVGLRDELERLGYVEDAPKNSGKPGRRFVLEVRQGSLPEVERFAEEFAQQRVDLIFAFPTLPVKAAQKATRANPIPIVFQAVSDPVGDGFVK